MVLSPIYMCRNFTLYFMWFIVDKTKFDCMRDLFFYRIKFSTFLRNNGTYLIFYFKLIKTIAKLLRIFKNNIMTLSKIHV